MQRLVYCSKAADDTGAADVFSIVEASARNNAGRGLTGFLIYDRDRFLQLLEGSKAALDDLMAVLAGDARHHSIEVIHRKDADERWFPDWKMKRLIAFDSVPALEELRETLRTTPGGPDVLALITNFLEVPG